MATTTKKEPEIVNDMPVKESVEKKGHWYIVSERPHPMDVSYQGELIVLPPKGIRRIANKNLLGLIPKGVKLFFREDN